MIRFVGVSNFSVEQIKQARDVVDIVSVQNQYNPWQRKPESDGVLEYCENENLTFLPWSPFGGSRRHKGLQDFPTISKLAQEKMCRCIVLCWRGYVPNHPVSCLSRVRAKFPASKTQYVLWM